MIELGWAFFGRYEACLDAFLKQQGVKLSSQLPLLRWLEEQAVNIPEDYSEWPEDIPSNSQPITSRRWGVVES